MSHSNLPQLWEEHTNREFVTRDNEMIGLLSDPALPVFGAETDRKVIDPRTLFST